MSKEKREVVSCLKCGQQLFNTAGYCKCGEKLPYAPIQDVEVVTLCSNCRKIEVYKNGMFVGVHIQFVQYVTMENLQPWQI